MNRKIIRIILIALLAMIFAVSAGMTIYNLIQYRKTLADTEEAMRIAGLIPDTQTRQPEATPTPKPPVPTAGDPADEDPEPTEEEPEDPLPPEASNLAVVNLEALRAYNPDIVGWIAIPGTVVSYPLVQGSDNDYYLNHNWKGEYNTSGSVFMSYDASRALTDFQTLVYGHNMQNETMFGTLKYYIKDSSYWQMHPSIYVVLDDVIYRYDIFAILDTNIYGFAFRPDIVQKHLEEEFFQNSKDTSVFDTGVTPETGDRVLSLSTCTTSNLRQSYRWVIQGVLAQEYGRSSAEGGVNHDA